VGYPVQLTDQELGECVSLVARASPNLTPDEQLVLSMSREPQDPVLANWAAAGCSDEGHSTAPGDHTAGHELDPYQAAVLRALAWRRSDSQRPPWWRHRLPMGGASACPPASFACRKRCAGCEPGGRVSVRSRARSGGWA